MKSFFRSIVLLALVAVLIWFPFGVVHIHLLPYLTVTALAATSSIVRLTIALACLAYVLFIRYR